MSDFESKLTTLSKERRAEFRRAHEAMLRAAAEARRFAIETNTGIVLFREGEILHVSAAELRVERDRAEAQSGENSTSHAI